MPARIIQTIEELKSLQGQEVGVSDWVEITQSQIDAFADLTGDRQWIHVDAKRATAESPYRTTIAHGFLTLSLLSTLLRQVVKLPGSFERTINYGLNRVRFPAAAPAGSRVRGRFTLQSAEDVAGGIQLVWNVTVDREDSEKPCLAAEWILRAYG